MKNISEIYGEYKILPGLQNHMLRVAAVASLICDNFNETLNKEDVVTACLLHDMGNIIKANLELFPSFLEPEGLIYWQGVKDEYIKKYGPNEHHASLEIIKELGVSKAAHDIVSVIDFETIYDIPNRSIETQISVYADCRVAPMGIMSAKQRLAEGRERYKNKRNEMSERQWDINEKVIDKIEEYIFSKCKIKPEDITDETVAPIISELKNFVVK